jgi:hypothetical protein
MKKVGIIGCGWLGFRIAENISGRYEVYTTTSTQDKIEKLTLRGFKPTIVNFSDDKISKETGQWEVCPTLDIIIITVSFSEKGSLSNKVHNLFSFIGDFKGQLFYMSSTGVYPNIEKIFLEDDVSSDSVADERIMKEKYPQVNILRLAGLMGDERLLRNYKITNLNFAVNHIHYTDICKIVEKMMDRQLKLKLYNVVSPFHPTKAEVINAQNNIEYSEKCEVKGKIISSSKLSKELDFVFKFPNPRNFHL